MAFAGRTPTHDLSPSKRLPTAASLLLRRRRFLYCAACSAAAATATLLVVAFTVFRVREPVMTMNSVTVKHLDLAAANLTVVADVSVKNPNAASFRYGGSATAVYYRAQQVGAAWGPPGTARARRTVRMNVTVEVSAGQLLGDPRFAGDLAAGEVGVSTSTRVAGRVRVLGVFGHHVELVMNCSVAVAVADVSIRNQSCWQQVWL